MCLSNLRNMSAVDKIGDIIKLLDAILSLALCFFLRGAQKFVIARHRASSALEPLAAVLGWFRGDGVLSHFAGDVIVLDSSVAEGPICALLVAGPYG
jgi:hypothetical protein